MRRALALALVLAALTTPVSGQAPRGIPAHPRELRFTPAPFEVPKAESFRHQLSNGVPVYVVPDRSLPLVEVAVVLRAGQYLDPPGKTGLASLTAAMLRRAGTARLAPTAFDEEADRLALELGMSAGATRAGASLSAPSWVLEPALALFFEALRQPRFDEERLAQAKRSLGDSLGARNDDPAALAEREWGWLLYGSEHFSQRALRPADLAALGREDLVAFHRRWWQPAGMVIAVSGDVEVPQLLALLERGFAGWEAGEKAPWPPPAPRHEPAPGTYLLERDLPQAKLLLGQLGPQRQGWDDPRVPAWTLLGELLGGRGARIASRVRAEQGLAYRAGATLSVGDAWPGELRVVIDTETANTPRVVELVRAELLRLRREPPAAAELDFVKRALVDGLPYLFDSAEEIAGYFAEDEYLGRPHSFWTSYRERLAAVTPADLRRAASDALDPDRLLVLVVGRTRDLRLPGTPVRLPARDPVTLEAR